MFADHRHQTVRERPRLVNALDRLRQAIDEQQRRLRATVPADRHTAILALLPAQDREQPAPGADRPPDLITGRRRANLGGNKALSLCLDATEDDEASAPAPAVDDW